jgi:integrase
VKDLDLDAGEVQIRRAYDERAKKVKGPKTDEGIRTVTVPAALLPLLQRIERERDDEDLVAPIVGATAKKYRATIFQDHLRAAGVKRAELFVETETHIEIDFRSLRDSGITWRFLAEHRAEVIQRESGHEHIATTLGYAKEIQDRKGRYGEPFPALPASLVRPPSDPDRSVSGNVSARARGQKGRKKGWGNRDLNPKPID